MKSILLMLFSAASFCAPLLAEQRDTLSYETTIVKVSGTIKQDTFPGPPNYRSIKLGDEREIYWILNLVHPVYVKGTSGNEINESESNVTQMQLVLQQDQYNSYRKLIGRKVIVIGTLFHSITGHHRTNVLMIVKSISAG